MNPKIRLPAPPTSPSAQGKPGRRFGLYIALSILLLVTGAGWGQPNGWKWLTGGKLNGVKFIGQHGWVVGEMAIKVSYFILQMAVTIGGSKRIILEDITFRVDYLLLTLWTAGLLVGRKELGSLDLYLEQEMVGKVGLKNILRQHFI